MIYVCDLVTFFVLVFYGLSFFIKLWMFLPEIICFDLKFTALFPLIRKSLGKKCREVFFGKLPRKFANSMLIHN